MFVHIIVISFRLNIIKIALANTADIIDDAVGSEFSILNRLRKSESGLMLSRFDIPLALQESPNSCMSLDI